MFAALSGLASLTIALARIDDCAGVQEKDP
jgi:hypothetical protein